ncbi:MAG: hypothetical protein JRI23_04440, partial [Deltaproteobacteria bacterium]|nr:hypothetical protein [Deltaproteobacteria bacterium]MBW2530792.1 hypothetical protein [Deltaproteobacteria bacterium]
MIRKTHFVTLASALLVTGGLMVGCCDDDETVDPTPTTSTGTGGTGGTGGT